MEVCTSKGEAVCPVMCSAAQRSCLTPRRPAACLANAAISAAVRSGVRFHKLVSLPLVSTTRFQPQSGGMSLSEMASSSCCCVRSQGLNTAKEPHIS